MASVEVADGAAALIEILERDAAQARAEDAFTHAAKAALRILGAA